MGGNDTPPLCECHGEAMLWSSQKGRSWRCAVKTREANKRYRNTEKGRAAKKRYDRSEKRRVLNESEHRKLQKQLYEMTRIRVR